MACSKLHKALWAQLAWVLLRNAYTILRKGGGTKLCFICGKGVINKFLLCQVHGYENEQVRAWQQKNAALSASISVWPQ